MCRPSTATAVLLLSALLAGGCSRNRSASGGGGAVVTLTYWTSTNRQEVALATELVGKWNRLHPKIQVRMQQLPVNQSTEEVIVAAVSAGTTPDICSNIWPGSVPEYARAGALVRLNQFADFDSLVRARMSEAAMAGFRSEDGNSYQIPWKTNPVMMIYNRQLFRRAGIANPPRTYSEYLADAGRLTFDENHDGVVDHWMGYRDVRPIWWQRFFDFYTLYCAAAGDRPIVEKGGVTADPQVCAEVFGFFAECFRNGFYPKTFFQFDPFIAGNVATEFVGPWTISYIKENYAGQIDYGIVPVPVPDSYRGPESTYGDHKCMVIFSTSRHPAEAWEFLKFLVNEEADLRLLQVASQIPVRRDIVWAPSYRSFFDANPDLRLFASQALTAREVGQSPDEKEIFDTISQVFEECSVYNRSTPNEAAAALLKRIGAILAWNR
ncbi:MAG: ABC transporter substrate-binding protein [Ignavibacteriales bacterium CG07_land_8_20_14_0_80_59_12]|nr:MAG: ABC transporter substrate-binding protein [Ignavibacteriales bacterium CG07_land_8_20_14_0_80_59_12]